MVTPVFYCFFINSDIISLCMKRVVNKRFAKGKGEYEKVINAIEKEGRCPFCAEELKYHKKPILKKEGSWIITENGWPYKNAKHHFLMINQPHKENFNEISTEDFESFRKLLNWAIKKYELKGGAFAMRFGDTDHTGATVSHLHAHLISPKLDKAKKSLTVNFPIG
jgi:diadenosine tetraphosphate (Ap4A) HIT family hydrolase